MNVLSIDPGPVESAFILVNVESGNWKMCGKKPNDFLRRVLREQRDGSSGMLVHALAVEMIASYGMPVGAEVFDTCVWIGRFLEAWGNDTTAHLVYRKEVKLHLCGTARAKDSNVRQALIDRYGGQEKAVGRAKSPGPLHSVKGDVWSALAVACTFADRQVTS